jgi:hypothetical protein
MLLRDCPARKDRTDREADAEKGPLNPRRARVSSPRTGWHVATESQRLAAWRIVRIQRSDDRIGEFGLEMR